MFKKILKLIFMTLFLAAISGGFYFALSPSGPYGVTENREDIEILIPKGCGLVGVTDILMKEKILRHPYGFMLLALVRNQTKSLQAGEYLIPAHDTMEHILHKISSGDVIHRSFTVTEGMTVMDAVTKLNENKLLSGTLESMPEEGRLLPSTYPYHRGESRKSLIDRMEKAMAMTLLELWKDRPKDCPLKNPDEALVLASIIEKETSQILKEQPRIAGVFMNRMKIKMRLQSDPTVIYGMTMGKKPLGRALTRNDLKHDSFYNTYRYIGLPPTPICCPRKEAIEAALNPDDHEELYFVANGTGGHSFAKTLEGHNKNVQEWRDLKQARVDAQVETTNTQGTSHAQ
ncbi:MAG: endolytic transglycosylase MltG [Alphaproteobacteria bacterium]|nr:endolytic transglycosylase MltG [Alphaproteobacteria bacterium]